HTSPLGNALGNWTMTYPPPVEVACTVPACRNSGWESRSAGADPARCPRVRHRSDPAPRLTHFCPFQNFGMRLACPPPNGPSIAICPRYGWEGRFPAEGDHHTDSVCHVSPVHRTSRWVSDSHPKVPGRSPVG